MSEVKPFQVERPWGNFRQFNLNTPVTVKILTVSPSAKLSLQSHNKRAEFWHVISGDGIMEIGENKYNVSAGDEQSIAIGVKHRLIAGPSGIRVLEVAVGDFLEIEDEVRYEDEYGRA